MAKEEKKEEKVENQTSQDETQTSEKENKKNKFAKQLEEAKAEADSWKNKYYTAYADLENLRKSIEKDHREALKYRAEGFIEKLIQPLDSFHMALSIEPKNDEMKAFLQGFSFIYQSIVSSMENEGLTLLEVKEGVKFNENIMHALDTIENDEIEENTVIKVYAPGYKLHERIIRPAMVYVSKKSKKEEENKPQNEEQTINA